MRTRRQRSQQSRRFATGPGHLRSFVELGRILRGDGWRLRSSGAIFPVLIDYESPFTKSWQGSHLVDSLRCYMYLAFKRLLVPRVTEVCRNWLGRLSAA